MYPAVVTDLEVRDYQFAYDYQKELVAKRKNDECEDTFLFVEHPHVFTLGRRKTAKENVLAPGDVPVIEIERGGDVTYHGPGQLVVYPVLKLREEERDLHKFLRNLEEAILDLGNYFGARLQRREGLTGVWCGDKKVASIGISCRRWVIFHGVAINVDCDLSMFGRINPCGLDSDVMSNLKLHSTKEITMDGVKNVLPDILAKTFNRQLKKGMAL